MNVHRSTTIACNAIALAGVIIGSGGCTNPKSEEASMKERQDAALRDPFGYGPKMPTSGPAKPEERSLKSDWDRFWNP